MAPEGGLPLANGDTVKVGARFVSPTFNPTVMVMFVPAIVAGPSGPKSNVRMSFAELMGVILTVTRKSLVEPFSAVTV